MLINIQAEKKSGTVKCKNDLKQVDGMDEKTFNNISGFVIFPKATNILDKTLVHPIMFHLAEAMCDTMKTTIEDIIRDGEQISFYKSDNKIIEYFICEKMVTHLKAGAKYLSFIGAHNFRTAWHDIIPGTLIYGKVRNITDFGIFVDINAATDGLVHISEVPQYLSHSLEDIVRPGDKIRVKILDVDSKKRRIALSMKHQTVEIHELLEYFNEK
jgi:uncharacterized protein